MFGKAGQASFGLGWFFASLQQRVIPGLCFFVFSVIDVQERQSYPIQVAQMVKTKGEKAQKEKQKPAKGKHRPDALAGKRPVGRPKGSKKKKDEKLTLSAELLRIQPVLQAFLVVLKGVLSISYLVMDGHFGNYPSAWMVRQTGLHFVSKLRYHAALYKPFSGRYRGRGPHPKHGDQIDVHKLNKKYLKSDTKEKGIRTRI